MAISKSSGSSQHQIAWTTARCNRLLRPLVLRITLLRKHVHNQHSQQNSPESTSVGSSISGDDVEEEPVISPDETVASAVGKQEKHDLDWAPFVARKRIIKRKYGGRKETRTATLKPENSTTAKRRPGEICISTPYLARTRPDATETPDGLKSGTCNDGLGSDAQSPSLHKSRGGRSVPLKSKAHLQDLRRIISSEEWTLYDNLYEAVSNLLKATTAALPLTQNGPRSLLSTCLRQVPAYVELEEYWRKEDDEDDKTDLSSEIYTHLETTLGGAQGWKPLREIVRAHGMALLVQLIYEGILTGTMVHAIANLLYEHQAVSEADDLLDAFSTLDVFEAPQNLEAELIPKGRSKKHVFEILVNAPSPEYADWVRAVGPSILHQMLHPTITGRRYRRIELMLKAQQLPLEWIAVQDMLPTWSRLIRSASARSGDNATALSLLHTTLLAGCGIIEGNPIHRNTSPVKHDVREAINNTISSLTTILTAIATIAYSGAGVHAHESSYSSALWTLQGLAVDIITAYGHGSEQHSSNRPTGTDRASQIQRAATILTSVLIFESSGYHLGPNFAFINIDECVDSINHLTSLHPQASSSGTSHILSALPSFICAVSRCCGRVWQDSGFTQLRAFVRSLLSPNTPRISSRSAWFLKRLALDSVFEFAEQSRAPEHFAFAREIEHSIRGAGCLEPAQGMQKQDGESPARGRGFRWEEGICEWVAATPAAALQRMKASALRLASAPCETVVSPSRCEEAQDTPCKPMLSRLLIGDEVDEDEKHRAKRRCTSPVAERPTLDHCSDEIESDRERTKRQRDGAMLQSRTVHQCDHLVERAAQVSWHPKAKRRLKRSLSCFSAEDRDVDELSVSETSDIAPVPRKVRCAELRKRRTLLRTASLPIRRAARLREAEGSDDELSFA